MELLFVGLSGVGIGLAARYLLPGRSTQGSVLVPAIGTATAAAVWVALTWLGWNWAGGWIWWVSLGASALVAVVANIAISRSRIRSDQQMLQRLAKTGAPEPA